MTASLFTTPSRALDANAKVCSGAKWRFYATGTTTPQAVYANAALSTSLGAVVTADSGGNFPAIYLDDSLQYRAVLKNASGSITIADIDPINPSSSGSGAAAIVNSTASITTGSFSASIVRLETRGFAAANDGGAATYERTTDSLAAGGSGIWWFTAADGSKWKIATADEHFAAQFGALGGAGIDARPILNAALSAPMVKVVNLGPLTHYFNGATTGSYSIKVPSGKGLRGVSPQISWLKLNPVTVGTQTTAIQTIYFEDDIGGFAEDFSLDCQRSGLGGGANDRVSGITINAKYVNGSGTRISRVDVYNATGYAHWEATSSTKTLRHVVREQCRAFNCQIGFETTGNSEVKTIDCYVDASAVPYDGGTKIAAECLYHEYGPISRVERVRCRGYGEAGAGMFPATVGADINTLIYEECFIEITNGVPALRPLGQSGYVIKDMRVIGGEYISANYDACAIENATVRMIGAKFYGGKNAESGAGWGSGVNVSTGGVVDLYQCECKGRAPIAGSGATYGVLQQGTGVVRVHGGKLEAVGPALLAFGRGGTVSLIAPAYMNPAEGGNGTLLPAYRQRKRGTTTSWTLYAPPGGGNPFNFTNITLDTAVASRALTDINLTLQYTDSYTGTVPNDISLTVSWHSDALIQVHLPPGVTTTNLTLRYNIIEWVS